MTFRSRLPALLCACALAALTPMSLQAAPDKALEARFDALIDPALMGSWLIREAIEERRFADATTYIGLIAQALGDYATGLDAATAVINGG